MSAQSPEADDLLRDSKNGVSERFLALAAGIETFEVRDGATLERRTCWISIEREVAVLKDNLSLAGRQGRPRSV